MEDKIKNIIVSLVMTIFFIGISILCIVKPEETFSKSERRQLESFPEVSRESLLSGEFQADFEKSSLDQFPYRDGFRSLKAIMSYYVFNQSDNNGIYVKDGYVSKIEYPLNEEMLTRAANRFKYVYDKFLKETDTNVYFTIIPDKNYYLNDGEYLSIDYDELISQMISQTEFMKYIDITDCLSLNSYYKTDTHWSQEKLIPVVNKLGNEMGINLKLEYTEKVMDKDFYGVYYGQAALPIKPDKIKYLTNDILDSVKVYDYQNEKDISLYDMEKAHGKDPYEMFLSGPLSLIEINNDKATTDRELIVFRDSFGSSITPLLAEGYKKITLVDIRYIHPNMLEKFIVFDKQDVLFMYSTLVLNNNM